MAEAPLNLELAAVNLTAGLRRNADDIVQRLVLACPERSRLRTADEMRAVARTLDLAAQHIIANAATLEAGHAG